MTLLAYHPIKAIYVLLAVAFEVLRFPLWILKYAIASGRPNPAWTIRQALGIKIVRLYLTHIAAIDMNTPIPLRPGWEGKQFDLIQPADRRYYAGPLTTGGARPSPLGVTWYPRKPTKQELEGQDVAIHLHGGAFVIGDGRTLDAGFAAATLIKHAKFPFVLAPQYRLSSGPTHAKFPAAFQDTLTAYLHLHLELGVPTSRIVISGDSAGGNLVLSFLRYIQHFGAAIDVPGPAAALAWSPWCEPYNSVYQERTRAAPNFLTDYIPSTFGAWGASRYIPGGLRDPTARYAEYINHLSAPLKTATPLWITTGSSEVLFTDITQLFEELRAVEGNEVFLDVQEHAPHDYILIGNILGFKTHARRAAHNAGEWVRRVRKERALANGKA